jgi:hypothetical protein
MNITIKGSVDAGKLNDELAAALGDWCVGWTPTHNANEAIVTLSPEREGDEQLVRDTIEAHIDAAPQRAFAAKAAKLEVSVQRRLDTAAQAMGYDDIKSAVTYAEEPAVSKFQTEGRSLRAWRSLTWAACYTILTDVVAGNRPEPTEAELLAELPPAP